MNRVKTQLSLILAVLVLGFAGSANAGLIRVAQESAPGAGDFGANVLGFIETYSTSLTIAGFYDYSSPNAASYNGDNNGGPGDVSNTSQSFFVEASDGLHYVVVHDVASDATGGNTRMTSVLLGGAGGGTTFTVEDDPGEGTSVADSGGDRIFSADHNWAPCCTDGFAIGSLAGDDTIYASFDSLPSSINAWQATNASGTDISLVIATDRRVEFSVPEPMTLSLLGIGLIAAGAMRRRQG